MEYFDFTLPGKQINVGHLHPLTQFMRKIVGFFTTLGFEVVEGPEVETEEYNFDKLNIPEDHPARDLWDTFWLKNDCHSGESRNPDPNESGSRVKHGMTENLLLRTHTSPVQLRAMETRKPPVRLIVPGRVFRHEATDARHETTFEQCEGLVIDKGVRMTDLIGVLKMLLQHIFGDVEIRVRPSFFPFVEPGIEVDMSCVLCKQKARLPVAGAPGDGGQGCSVCGGDGWLEMLGAGLVHPRVLKNMGIDPKEYNGYAFGIGVDRLMMLHNKVTDIRLSYGGDLRFVKQF